MGLWGVREAAKRDKKLRFTALLHHVCPELLQASYFALKRSAAPGVDGMTGTSTEVIRVLDADIRGFFDAIDHEWLMRFLEHRIADRRVLRLIRKWLRAGVSEDGKWSRTTVGTPQGAGIPASQIVQLAREIGAAGIGKELAKGKAKPQWYVTSQEVWLYIWDLNSGEHKSTVDWP
jgi:hypothetical protein